VYWHNPLDPVWPDWLIAGNHHIVDQSANLHSPPDIPMYNIDEEETAVDSAFQELPQPVPLSWVSLKKREKIIQKRIEHQQRMLKFIRTEAVRYYADSANNDIDESEVT
jgi:hypothetical protein